MIAAVKRWSQEFSPSSLLLRLFLESELFRKTLDWLSAAHLAKHGFRPAFQSR
jgi:hypothetical protein